MSLQVDDERRRGRSRSPAARDRDRSPRPAVVVDADPYARGADRDRPASAYEFEDRRSSYRPPPSPVQDAYGGRRGARDDGGGGGGADARVRNGGARREKEYRYEKERYSDRDRDSDRERGDKRAGGGGGGVAFAAEKYLPQKYAQKVQESDAFRFMTSGMGGGDRDRYDEDLAYGGGGDRRSPPGRHARQESRQEPEPSGAYRYGQPKQWEYAAPEKDYAYARTDSLDVRPAGPGRRSPSPAPQHAPSASGGGGGGGGGGKRYYRDSLTADPRGSSASIVTVEPGAGGGLRSAMKRSASPQPPSARMASLTVNTGHHGGASPSLASAPPSPLLESYHGTYQSMSPMPSPMLLPTQGPGDAGGLPAAGDVSPAGSDDEPGGGRRRSRRARFHDPVDDASRLARALKGDRPPQLEPLIEILPGLTHEQVMDLRAEYKRLVKTGPDRKGVNVAKHIRARLKDEEPSLTKACYATALGRWESEAYWANFWYQGDKTRRELLIEALMGRTNDEIRAVKDGFSDRKYDNSLARCMKTELKEDKFKRAVLLVLEERRMDEADRHGRPAALDRDLVEEDVVALRRAVKADKGGESAMIGIVVLRSDAHLREVLRVYGASYRSNFARDALKKSGNLVGELLAHILNGVINRPVRDALLVHHALTASRRDELRRELLTSRLVRFHWDAAHMAAVKAAYRERYGRDMQEAVRDGTSGEWGRFCCELCISRVPGDVRRVERIEVRR